jgi:hypothetical protein
VRPPALLAATLGIACALAAPSAAAVFRPLQTQVTLPARGAFYYPWYPQTWTVGGQYPHYNPSLGYYSSSDSALVDQHIGALDYAHIDVAIASWWGPDTQQETTRIPLLLNRTIARGSSLKWALFHEQEGQGNPTVAQIQSDLTYIRNNYANHSAHATVNGKPVIVVWNANDSSCDVVNRWMQAAAGAWYVIIKVFSGYLSCSPQPSWWYQYAPVLAETSQPGYSFAVSPGFWKADEPTPRLARDVNRFQQNVRNMIASHAPWQWVTTFNEWGEGTEVESASQWSSPSGYGQYLDHLHENDAPTAVAFRSAGAAWTRAGVVLRWRTASESRLLGFNVYRKGVRLNRALIPSVFAGTTTGRSYSWLDRRAPRQGVVRYWLEAVSVSGKRSRHGPIVIS